MTVVVISYWKSFLLIGYQQICHWFWSFVVERRLCETDPGRDSGESNRRWVRMKRNSDPFFLWGHASMLVPTDRPTNHACMHFFILRCVVDYHIQNYREPLWMDKVLAYFNTWFFITELYLPLSSSLLSLTFYLSLSLFFKPLVPPSSLSQSLLLPFFLSLSLSLSLSLLSLCLCISPFFTLSLSLSLSLFYNTLSRGINTT